VTPESPRQGPSKQLDLEDSELPTTLAMVDRLEKELKEEKSKFKWALVFLT